MEAFKGRSLDIKISISDERMREEKKYYVNCNVTCYTFFCKENFLLKRMIFSLNFYMIRLKIHTCITSIYFNPGQAEQILSRGPKISKYLVILLSIYIFKKSQLGTRPPLVRRPCLSM